LNFIKKSNFFLVVLFFLISYIINTALILIYFWKNNSADSNLLQFAISLLFFFVGTIFSVYLYKRFFLKKLNLEPSFYSNKYLVLVSASLAFFVDLNFKGIQTYKGEFIFIVISLYVSIIFHLKKFEEINLSKDRYILSLSKTFSSAFLYLTFVVIFYFGSEPLMDNLDLKNLLSSIFSSLPNILGRIVFIFPILFFFSIPIIFIGPKNRNSSYPDILDDDF